MTGAAYAPYSAICSNLASNRSVSQNVQRVMPWWRGQVSERRLGGTRYRPLRDRARRTHIRRCRAISALGMARPVNEMVSGRRRRRSGDD
jgi:hypothetical protein